jgi:hypothetical protein
MMFTLPNSPLAKLPPELLEKILLEVVVNDKPRYESTAHFESMANHIEKSEAISTTLAFRTVCTTFRDSAWRALAKMIDYTTFDLRSRDSIGALEAISKTPEVAPWVFQLNFACHATFEQSPIPLPAAEDYGEILTSLSESAREDFLQIKKKEQDWYPDLDHRCSNHMPFPSSAPVLLKTLLAKHFVAFNNIGHIRYVHAASLPPGRNV